MKKAKVLLLNTVVLTVTSLVINTVGISFNVYISNKIGAEAMGLFQLIMSVYMFGITLSISGIGLAVTRLVAEELALDREGGALLAVRKCMAYALFFGLLSAALLLVGAKFIGVHWLHNRLTVRPLYVLAVSLPFISLSSVLNGYFTAVRRVVKTAATQIMKQFVEIFAVIYILSRFLPGGLEMACLALVLGGTASQLFSFLCNFFLYFLDQRRYKNAVPADSNLRNRMLAISVPIALSTYIRSALGTVKQVITPLFLEKSGVSCNTALAQYGIIRGMVMPVIMFPASFLSALNSLLVPEIARLHVAKNHSKINFAISKIFKITLLFSICIGGIVFNFSGALGVALYKSEEASFYIRLFSVLIPVMYFDDIVDGLLKGLNQQVKVVQINIIDTVITIGLICLLLPLFGIKGYIVVIFISEILNAALSVSRLLKAATCRIEFVNWLLKPALAIIASLFLTSLIPANFIAGMAVAVILYLVILYGLGSLSKEDFRLFF